MRTGIYSELIPVYRNFINWDKFTIIGIVAPVRNPYAPGAGSPPPELTGRDELRRTVQIALQRLPVGRPAKSVLFVGLRGVGKTVLLDRMRFDADAVGLTTLWVEAPKNRSLPAILAPQLRAALLKLSRNEQVEVLATRALRGLAGFVGALKCRYRDIGVALDFDPEPGLADNGDLEQDLQALLEVTGLVAKSPSSVRKVVTVACWCLASARGRGKPGPRIEE